VTLKGALLSRIVFATHHLATDESINQFQAIVCRGVLATYGNEFAGRIHDLFHRSLGVFGFLGLGKRESLEMSPHRDCYTLLSQGSRLYWREC
jgi:chemotaxis protein methyltransferase CheR